MYEIAPLSLSVLVILVQIFFFPPHLSVDYKSVTINFYSVSHRIFTYIASFFYVKYAKTWHYSQNPISNTTLLNILLDCRKIKNETKYLRLRSKPS